MRKSNASFTPHTLHLASVNTELYLYSLCYQNIAKIATPITPEVNEIARKNISETI